MKEKYWNTGKDKTHLLEILLLFCFSFIVSCLNIWCSFQKWSKIISLRKSKSMTHTLVNKTNLKSSLASSDIIFKVKSITGGPRNSRSFYMRFRLFASLESSPNLIIHGLSLAYSQFFYSIGYNNQLKMILFSHTVLPRYSRFHYLRYFSWTANYEGPLYLILLMYIKFSVIKDKTLKVTSCLFELYFSMSKIFNHKTNYILSS